jgi:hypothetical protein
MGAKRRQGRQDRLAQVFAPFLELPPATLRLARARIATRSVAG